MADSEHNKLFASLNTIMVLGSTENLGFTCEYPGNSLPIAFSVRENQKNFIRIPELKMTAVATEIEHILNRASAVTKQIEQVIEGRLQAWLAIPSKIIRRGGYAGGEGNVNKTKFRTLVSEILDMIGLKDLHHGLKERIHRRDCRISIVKLANYLFPQVEISERDMQGLFDRLLHVCAKNDHLLLRMHQSLEDTISYTVKEMLSQGVIKREINHFKEQVARALNSVEIVDADDNELLQALIRLQSLDTHCRYYYHFPVRCYSEMEFGSLTLGSRVRLADTCGFDVQELDSISEACERRLRESLSSLVETYFDNVQYFSHFLQKEN
jgi:hypothetical protein